MATTSVLRFFMNVIQLQYYEFHTQIYQNVYFSVYQWHISQADSVTDQYPLHKLYTLYKEHLPLLVFIETFKIDKPDLASNQNITISIKQAHYCDSILLSFTGKYNYDLLLKERSATSHYHLQSFACNVESYNAL